METYKNIDEYIGSYPENIQAILKKIRESIRRIAPGAEERISYGMPTFRLRRNIAHFAAFKKHIGFYPGPGAIEAFKEDLAEYDTSKGTVRFEIGKPIPYGLIEQIVRFNIETIPRA